VSRIRRLRSGDGKMPKNYSESSNADRRPAAGLAGPESVLAWASFTVMERPQSDCPLRRAMASSASSIPGICTNAKPRGAPVLRSVAILTEETRPYRANIRSISLSVA
jgi:hypothetical protein